VQCLPHPPQQVNLLLQLEKNHPPVVLYHLVSPAPPAEVAAEVHPALVREVSIPEVQLLAGAALHLLLQLPLVLQGYL